MWHYRSHECFEWALNYVRMDKRDAGREDSRVEKCESRRDENMRGQEGARQRKRAVY